LAGLRAIKIPVKNPLAKVKNGGGKVKNRSLAIWAIYGFYMATISKQVACHLPFSWGFRRFYVDKACFPYFFCVYKVINPL
jgi:hypothetical protein